ncbi:54S ribosomal protein L17 mitochondrial [Rhizophlyctis rosea]|nr:54S ribosomal protein L17 mitochondrial [Rhizophlyctis rosea]
MPLRPTPNFPLLCLLVPSRSITIKSRSKMSIRRPPPNFLRPRSTPSTSTQTRHLATQTTPKIHIGILLKRNPILLRPLTPFETTYYTYRQSLSNSESRPFDKDFYFRKGTAALDKWEAAQAQAQKNAERSGQPYVPVQVREEEMAKVNVASRETEADRSGDVGSLDRALERTVYLVVKGEGGRWEFPAGPVDGEEFLHEVRGEFLFDLRESMFYHPWTPLTDANLNPPSHRQQNAS